MQAAHPFIPCGDIQIISVSQNKHKPLHRVLIPTLFILIIFLPWNQQ